jgi:hypothetical protein
MKRNGAIGVAFVLGAAVASGVLRLAVPPTVAAQAPNSQLLDRVNSLEQRVATLEGTPVASGTPSASVASGPVPAGSVPVTSSGVQNVQVSQLVTLQSAVNSLQTQLGKLQTQFANHYHTYTTHNDPGSAHEIETILQCPGIGKPCTSASNLNEITVFIPPSSPVALQTDSVNTSGPLISGQ